jgi:phosphoribosylamine--glycine ligase
VNILILGSGGREHALAWAAQQHPAADLVVVAPGNAGSARVAERADLDPTDRAAVAELAVAEAIDLCIVGPEAVLAAGVADRLREAGVAVLGPSAEAARLETSKAFAKDVCDAAGVATAAWTRCEDMAAVERAVTGGALVVKADGLAAGKGVVVAEDEAEALEAAAGMLASGPVVMEERLRGREASFFALCDGEEAVAFGTAQDHKRAWDGDRGPNTGGMGAFSPSPVLAGLEGRVMAEVIRPVLGEMARRGVPYSGVLYAGLMVEGRAIRVVEFNARLGDPEAQVLMMRLGAQAVDLMLACAEGRLAGERAHWADDHALCVVMASGGYPGAYEAGVEIGGLDALPETSRRMAFHAGTSERGGRLVSSGGRVLAVAAREETLAAARGAAYDLVGAVDLPGGHWRTDIGAADA